MNHTDNQLNHLAIIPDGNTRWASAKNLPAFLGYQEGTKRVVELTRHARKIGIHTLTFWGLSTENWINRPKQELDFLVILFQKTIEEHLRDAMENGVKIVHLGNKDRLPKSLIDKIIDAEEKTKDNDKYILNLALDYGGHDELMRAMKKSQEDIQSGKITSDDLGVVVKKFGKQNWTKFATYLDNGNQPFPFPDFIVRTSGEVRLSGFMPWQSAYSEFFFEPVFFPDFTPEKLDQAIEVYHNRKRNFGGGHKSEI